MIPNFPHARAFDLAGWPCPPRVRDIPNHENSWGYIHMRPNVAQDDLGYLWVNGNAVPAFRTPNGNDADPGALVIWTATGIGLWVHPKSLRYLGAMSRLDMEPDQWLPVSAVCAELPPFVKEAIQP